MLHHIRLQYSTRKVRLFPAGGHFVGASHTDFLAETCANKTITERILTILGDPWLWWLTRSNTCLGNSRIRQSKCCCSLYYISRNSQPAILFWIEARARRLLCHFNGNLSVEEEDRSISILAFALPKDSVCGILLESSLSPTPLTNCRQIPRSGVEKLELPVAGVLSSLWRTRP
jgi:hypothetical protein